MIFGGKREREPKVAWLLQLSSCDLKFQKSAGSPALTEWAYTMCFVGPRLNIPDIRKYTGDFASYFPNILEISCFKGPKYPRHSWIASRFINIKEIRKYPVELFFMGPKYPGVLRLSKSKGRLSYIFTFCQMSSMLFKNTFVLIAEQVKLCLTMNSRRKTVLSKTVFNWVFENVQIV